MELAIIVVNYRTAALTIDCLASLLGDQGTPANTHIMIVDGGSADGSAQKIAAAIDAHNAPDRVSFLPLDVNGGFAYGNNRGIEAVRAMSVEPDFFLLLNPDTVVHPGAVAALLDFMKANPKAGIAGSRLEDPDGTPQACAFRFLSAASEFESEIKTGPVSRLLRRRSVALVPDSDKPSRVDWVSGASMMVRSEVFREVGLMDEAYFLYYEELDFELRAARAGWECWHVPQSRVIHLVGQSTGVSKRQGRPARRPAYWFESRKRYFVKNYGRAYTAFADLAWVAGHVGWRARQTLTGKANEGPPMLLRDFVRHSFSSGSK